MHIADHLITHQQDKLCHGLYAGANNVIHLNSAHQVVISHLDSFSHHQTCFVRTYPFRPYTRECSLQRAYQLLQHMPEHNTPQNPLFATDEQFVAWCIKGAPMMHNNATTHSDTNTFNWQSDVIEPVSRVLAQTLVRQLVERLTRPGRLTNTIRTVARSTKQLRYLK